MPSTEPRLRRPIIAVLLLLAVPACGGGGEDGSEYAADFEDGGEPARIEVDPCALLTKEEIAEQLFRSIPANQREGYSTPEFDIETSEPDLGVSRMCEYRFASRATVGGGPIWHSDFNLVVFPANAIALPEDKRKPIAGAGPEMFKESGTAAAYYVVKGGLAVSLTRFPGTAEDLGDNDAGRVLLLSRIAERLP